MLSFYWRLLHNRMSLGKRREITLPLNTCTLPFTSPEHSDVHGGIWRIIKFRWMQRRFCINKDTFFSFILSSLPLSCLQQDLLPLCQSLLSDTNKGFFYSVSSLTCVGCFFVSGGWRLVSAQRAVTDLRSFDIGSEREREERKKERLRHLVAARCKRVLIAHVRRQWMVNCRKIAGRTQTIMLIMLSR